MPIDERSVRCLRYARGAGLRPCVTTSRSRRSARSFSSLPAAAAPPAPCAPSDAGRSGTSTATTCRTIGLGDRDEIVVRGAAAVHRYVLGGAWSCRRHRERRRVRGGARPAAPRRAGKRSRRGGGGRTTPRAWSYGCRRPAGAPAGRPAPDARTGTARRSLRRRRRHDRLVPVRLAWCRVVGLRSVIGVADRCAVSRRLSQPHQQRGQEGQCSLGRTVPPHALPAPRDPTSAPFYGSSKRT